MEVSNFKFQISNAAMLAAAAACIVACGRAGSHDTVRTLPVPSIVVDDSPNVGIGASLKFDARGMPHISYYDLQRKALKYIYFAKTAEGAGKWVPTYEQDELDPTTLSPTGRKITTKGTEVDVGTQSAGDGRGKWNALNVEAGGRPHIVYYDDDNKQIKYAWGSTKRIDGVWEFNKVTLDSESRNVGQWISAVMDDTGSLHVAYVSFDPARKGAVKYLRWDRQRPDEGGEWEPAVDGDKPPVQGVFLDPNQLARGDDPSKTSIAVSAPDADHQPNTVYVVYYDPNREGAGQPNGDLKLAQKPLVGGEWETMTIDDLQSTPQSPGDGTPSDVGRWASVTVDHRGRLHVSYTDSLAGDLKYVLYDTNLKKSFPRYRKVKNFDRGTLQVKEELAPVAAGKASELVLIREENLSEFSQAEGEVLIEEWVGQIVEDGIDPGTGLESTIAMGPNQRPLVSYRDGATGDLKLAIQVTDTGSPEGYAWTIQTVDTPKIVGLWSSMASFTYSESALEGWVIGIAYEGFDQKPDTSLERRLMLRLLNPFVTDVF